MYYTHKRVAEVALKSDSLIVKKKRKIMLYCLAELNLMDYIPVAIDE